MADSPSESPWSDPRVLQESTGKMNVMSVTLRRLNQSESVHKDTPERELPSTIAMFYLQKNSYDDLRVYVRFSDDEARSFGDPVRVTSEPGYHVMNNDRVTQLSSGRLLAPVASNISIRTRSPKPRNGVRASPCSRISSMRRSAMQLEPRERS